MESSKKRKSKKKSAGKSKIKQGIVSAGITLVVFLSIGIYSINSYQTHKTKLTNKIAINNVSKQIVIDKIIQTPTLTPSPILNSIPTSIPKPSGFCLSVPVLFYHHIEDLAKAEKEGHKAETVAPEIFDSQMQYLVSSGYRTIKAEELVNAISSHQNLGKAAVVTIDDGYDDTYSNAYPIAKKYGVVLNLMIPTGLLENSGFMTWGQLQEMVSNGEAAYDHTWSHYSLNQGSNEKVTTEIMTAKDQLNQHLGISVNIFTYPYGSYSQRVINILQNNGFKAAFTTVPGRFMCEENLLSLPRTRIGNASLSAYGI